MKICRSCKAEKPMIAFSKNKNTRDGMSASCKVCDSDRSREYQAKNKEKIARRKEKYRIENLDRSKKMQNEASVRYRAKSPEKHCAFVAAYRASSRDKIAETLRNSRAKRKGAEGRHERSDIISILESQRGLCANCYVELINEGSNKYHVDHIMPLAKGGSNWPSNLQCLCPSCNHRKSAKDPIVWAQENGRLL